jgi:hypothetical protein
MVPPAAVAIQSDGQHLCVQIRVNRRMTIPTVPNDRSSHTTRRGRSCCRMPSVKGCGSLLANSIPEPDNPAPGAEPDRHRG